MYLIFRQHVLAQYSILYFENLTSTFSSTFQFYLYIQMEIYRGRKIPNDLSKSDNNHMDSILSKLMTLLYKNCDNLIAVEFRV